MAVSYETLSREGLIYALMVGIARIEGKHDSGSKWTGDRAYISGSPVRWPMPLTTVHLVRSRPSGAL